MTSIWRPEDELRPYSIEAVCAADRADGRNYILVDVGRDSRGHAVPSLERLQRMVKKVLAKDKHRVSTTTKLYIVGDWNAAKPEEEQNEKQKTLAHAKEWKDAINTVCKLIRAMGNLKELVWTSGLPFMPSVFNDLPTKLTKLVLDLSNHVRIVDNGVTLTKLHITAEDMKPLLKQTRLLELRLLRLRDSFQFVAWKSVYLNKLPGGMRILELQMDDIPIIRNNNDDKWHRAAEVRGLTVAQPGLLEKPYKGRDGKGGLHWSFGYGEYLDGNCIRKARITSGVEKAMPLPLQCLKLDGFVVDHLPFEHELRDIALLSCGEKCIDAGMRAPKTQAQAYYAWSKKVNNAACRFLLQWPNWTGIFDTEGDQRDTHGDVVAQEIGLSTPYTEYAPTPLRQLPLTEDILNMKDVNDAINDVPRPDSFKTPQILQRLSIPDTPLGAVSNLSERGSEVPTLTGLSIATTDGNSEMDGSLTPGLSSVGSSRILHVNSASDSTPEISPTSPSCNSSFGSDGPPRGHKVRKSLSDSYWVFGPS